MARQNLSGLTPAEVKAHKNKQAKARMAKMRAPKKEEREMAKRAALLTSASPDVVEFIAEIDDLPLSAKVELIAAWEREQKQTLPVEPFAGVLPDESSEDYWRRKLHARDLHLAKALAHDFIGRKKAGSRKSKFNGKQATEAQRLGITVFELQQRRKTAALDVARKQRELERLARKEAA